MLVNRDKHKRCIIAWVNTHTHTYTHARTPPPTPPPPPKQPPPPQTHTHAHARAQTHTHTLTRKQIRAASHNLTVGAAANRRHAQNDPPGHPVTYRRSRYIGESSSGSRHYTSFIFYIDSPISRVHPADRRNAQNGPHGHPVTEKQQVC